MRTLPIFRLLFWAFAILFWLGLVAFSWSPAPYWPDADGYTLHLAEGRYVAHPPGYLLFVLLGHAFQALTSSPYAAAQAATFLLAASSLFVLPILLKKATGNFLIARFLTLAFAFSWGLLVIVQTGTSHTSDLLCVSLLLLASLRLLKQQTPRPADWVFLGVCIVLLAGFRLTSLIFQFPLLLFLALLQFRHPGGMSARLPRILRIAATYFLAGLVILAIQILVIHLSGGWQAYSEYAASMHEGNRASSILLSGINGPTLLNIFRAFLWFGLAAGPLLLFAFFLDRSCLRDPVFQAAILSSASVLGFCATYLCTHPGYLAGALPGLCLAVGKIWETQIKKPHPRTLRWIPLSATAFGTLLFVGLAPIKQPSSPRGAVLNGLLLQYGRTAARQAVFHTTSEWLIICGFEHLVPPARVEQIKKQRRAIWRPSN